MTPDTLDFVQTALGSTPAPRTSPPKAPLEPSGVDAALTLARLGFRVFPLVPNSKLPAIQGWPKKATTDESTIRRWWTCPVMGWPQPYGVGVATGQGLVVADVDVKDGKPGLASMETLKKEHGDLPATMRVRTPSGGLHLYFQTTKWLKNSVSSLAPGVDIRGDGGQVVGPFTEIDGKQYVAEGLCNLESLPTVSPAWEARMVEAPPAQKKRQQSASLKVPLNTPDTIARGKAYLDNEAQLAIEGAGGDSTTYKVAARLKDFGLDKLTALQIMLDHWNDRCSPPWDPEELAVKVANAYLYGENPPGIASPAADFEPVQINEGEHPLKSKPTETETKGSTLRGPTPILGPKHLEIRPRPWIIKDFLLRRTVGVLVAPGGVGKSTVTLALALAVATGRGEDIVGVPVKESGPVWLYNNEDDTGELHRRLAALMQHHNVSEADLIGKDGKPLLYVDSGEAGLFIIATKNGEKIKPCDRDGVIDAIQKHGVKLFIADPLIETHSANENSNEEMSQVMGFYRDIAQKGDCGVFVVHHTRKPPQGQSDGHAGNMDSGRGASAVPFLARTQATLYPMSDKDADRTKTPRGDRWRFIRLDLGKMNMAVRTGRPKWYELASVNVPCGADPLDVESVGVAVPTAIEDCNDAKAKAEAEKNATLAAAAVDLIPAGEKRVSINSLAESLRKKRPDLAPGTLPTVVKMIIKAFNIPHGNDDESLWAYEDASVSGRQGRYWLVHVDTAKVEA